MSAQPILSYSGPTVGEPPRFVASRVIAFFGIGAVVTTWFAMLLLGGVASLQNEGMFGVFFAWGESAGVMLAIKIRGRIKRGRLRERPPLFNAIAGALHSIAMYFVIENTSGQPRYYRSEALPYVLAGIAGAAMLSAATGYFLAPAASRPAVISSEE